MYNIITDRYKKFVMRKFLFYQKPLCVCVLWEKLRVGQGERESTTGGHHDEGVDNLGQGINAKKL